MLVGALGFSSATGDSLNTVVDEMVKDSLGSKSHRLKSSSRGQDPRRAGWAKSRIETCYTHRVVSRDMFADVHYITARVECRQRSFLASP